MIEILQGSIPKWHTSDKTRIQRKKYQLNKNTIEKIQYIDIDKQISDIGER